jgi:hypothetical protein
MKSPRSHRLIAFALVCGLALTVHAATKKENKQKGIRKMAKDTLQRFYRAVHMPEELAASNDQWLLPNFERVTLVTQSNLEWTQR